MFDSAKQAIASRPWGIGDLARKWFFVMTGHYQLHQPEHVGMFAGSLLSRSDWDHN
jgi:hypothetical protein